MLTATVFAPLLLAGFAAAAGPQYAIFTQSGGIFDSGGSYRTISITNVGTLPDGSPNLQQCMAACNNVASCGAWEISNSSPNSCYLKQPGSAADFTNGRIYLPRDGYYSWDGLKGKNCGNHGLTQYSSDGRSEQRLGSVTLSCSTQTVADDVTTTSKLPDQFRTVTSTVAALTSTLTASATVTQYPQTTKMVTINKVNYPPASTLTITSQRTVATQVVRVNRMRFPDSCCYTPPAQDAASRKRALEKRATIVITQPGNTITTTVLNTPPASTATVTNTSTQTAKLRIITAYTTSTSTQSAPLATRTLIIPNTRVQYPIDTLWKHETCPADNEVDDMIFQAFMDRGEVVRVECGGNSQLYGQ